MQDRVHFDGWTLLRPTGELSRGGTRVRLQGQPVQVLEALLERPGELVTREQLIARLWPGGVIVDFDTALNSAMRRLRTALDDHADHPRYIETIPRRGYRFIGKLDPLLPGTEAGPLPTAARSPRLAWMGLAAGVVLTLAGLGTWRAASEPEAPAVPPAARNAVADAPAAVLEHCERARYFFGRRGEGDTARALALFQEAVRIMPTHAPAWAGIASTRWIDTMEERTTREAGLPQVRAAAERALSLDPANGEALLRLANYHRAMGDRAAAEIAINRAAEVAPNDPLLLAFQSDRARAAGRLDEALELQRRAVQHDPLAVAPRHNLVVLLFVVGRYEEARTQLRELTAISPLRFPPDTVIGQSLLLGGDPAAALDFAGSLSPGVVRDQLEALSYFALGQSSQSEAALQRLAATDSKSRAWRLAEVHAYRGETDAAFDWLRRAVDTDHRGCARGECWPSDWIALLPLLRPLHVDPRWPAMRAALVAPPARPQRS